MLFNSAVFLLFLPLVLLLYRWVPTKKRLHLLLLASYVFYAWWNPYFLFLIVGSTLLDYFCGLKIATEPGKKKLYLWISLLANLGVLGIFKYANFFIETVDDLGLAHWDALHLILPVGISFYTFQSMSYTIDVYRREREAENSLLAFATYISFFPQLVAGPIERSSTILPQLKGLNRLKNDNLKSGLALAIWGFFKKVVIADQIAYYIEPVFQFPDNYSGWANGLAVIGFSIQILADFSGYTDIARGCARMFGVQLSLNFVNPYLAKNPVELWKRWHITLSEWFRDYVYIPLGGSRKVKNRLIINLGLTFVLSGLWHGASWNFVIWGGFHGLLVIGWHLLGKKFKFPGWLGIATTFFLTCFGWIFFRAADWSTAMAVIHNIFTWKNPALNWPDWNNNGEIKVVIQLLLVAFMAAGMLLTEALNEKRSWSTRMKKFPPIATLFVLGGLILICWYFGRYTETPFIYFQF